MTQEATHSVTVSPVYLTEGQCIGAIIVTVVLLTWCDISMQDEYTKRPPKQIEQPVNAESTLDAALTNQRHETFVNWTFHGISQGNKTIFFIAIDVDFVHLGIHWALLFLLLIKTLSPSKNLHCVLQFALQLDG